MLQAPSERRTVSVKQINLYLYQSAKKMNFAGHSFLGNDVPNIFTGMINELKIIIINYILKTESLKL